MNYVTPNYMENGGERWVLRGTLDREGAPVLPVAALQAALIQHYHMAPDAASATAVHAAENMGAIAFSTLLNITSPDYPRTVTIKGNVAGIAGNVVIHGTNYQDEVITDTIALNGVAEVEGIKAFKTVTRYDMPVRTHAPVAQVETAVAVGTITQAGDATVTVTANGMGNSPKPITVPVALNDVAADWAEKVRDALAADADVSAMFSVGGSGANIVLTALTPATNDATLNIALADDTSVGITEDATSDNTTAGVPYDTVSIGIGKKFGLPHIVANAACLLVKLFNGAADNGTLAVDADEIEKNLFALDGTPDGTKTVDLYYLV